MVSKADFIPANLCGENISILHLLHYVPKLPSRNIFEQNACSVKGYTLSIAEERQLAEALAFLSNDSEDIDHIPALCIQQDSEIYALNVLLAVNRTGLQDGNQTLQRLRLGFEKIFVTLTKNDREPKHQTSEDGILTAIVSMCMQRILHRIRMTQSKRYTPKQPIQDTLRIAIDGIKLLRKRDVQSSYPDATEFMAKAKDVIKTVDAWTKYQTITGVTHIVNAVHQLKHSGDIQAIIGNLNNQEMAPSSRKSLVNIIDKVSRYREIARYLYRMRKKGRLPRSITVTTIELPISAYGKMPVTAHTPSLSSALKRIDDSLGDSDIRKICLSIGTTELQANEQFSCQAIRTTNKAKIHAEVQLVYYCELNPSKLPPRIIASSKDACFLCNAFIVMYGKMHVTRTHGRLYPGWRLPVASQFDGLQDKFNAVLANQVRTSVATTLSKGKKIVFPDPNESTLLTLPHSATTVCNSQTSRVVADFQSDSSLQHDPGPSNWKTAAIAEAAADVEPILSNTGNAISTIVSSDCTSETNATLSAATSSETGGHEVDLIQGCAITVSKSTYLYKAGPLHLHMEYPMDNTIIRQTTVPTDVSYSLEWLSSKDKDKLVASDKARILDVNSLQDRRTCTVDDQGHLFLAIRDTVVKITMRPEPSYVEQLEVQG